MRLVVSEVVQSELESARDYYLRHGTARIAVAFVDAYEHALGLLMNHPQIGKPFGARHRQLMLRGFPYSLVYRLTTELIIIDAVAHERRRPGYWQQRR